MDEIHHRQDPSEALSSWSGGSRGVPCYTTAKLDYRLVRELEGLDDPQGARAQEIRGILGVESEVFRGVANPEDPETPLIQREILRAFTAGTPLTTAEITDQAGAVLDIPGGVTRQKIFSVLRLMVKTGHAQRTFDPAEGSSRRIGRWRRPPGD